MTDQNLTSLFRRADTLRSSVESAQDALGESYLTNLSDAIKDFQECRVLADRLSLFSSNETLEDTATGDLKYLNIDYKLAELLSRESRDRRNALQGSRAAFEQYLGLLDQYGILRPVHKKVLQTYQDGPQEFSTISTTDPGARRAAKIANFREEKEMKKKLEFLSQNPAYLEKDEDAVREVELLNIQFCIHHTFQGLENINREEAVLATAPQDFDRSVVQDDHRERNGRSDTYSDRLDRRDLVSTSQPILAQDGRPLRPFTLLNDRQQLQNGVFRAGHNLPTMTIDEYLEEERARGGIIEGGGAVSGIPPEPDEDNYEKGDAETMKAREWDEYVEANPKGSGNTLNRG